MIYAGQALIKRFIVNPPAINIYEIKINEDREELLKGCSIFIHIWLYTHFLRISEKYMQKNGLIAHITKYMLYKKSNLAKETICAPYQLSKLKMLLAALACQAFAKGLWKGKS